MSLDGAEKAEDGAEKEVVSCVSLHAAGAASSEGVADSGSAGGGGAAAAAVEAGSDLPLVDHAYVVAGVRELRLGVVAWGAEQRVRSVCRAASCFYVALRCLCAIAMRGCSGAARRGACCVHSFPL